MQHAFPSLGRLAAVLAVTSFSPIAAYAQSSAEDAATSLDEIVVTATRRDKPLLEVAASVTVQSVADLRAKGFSYGTDEFRGVPGVFFRRGEGDAEEFPFISIRGVTGNHGNDTFLALVDGIPFVGPDEEVLLYEVPYGAVDNIEIVRGPVSALYGRGGIAGAVNYRTRQLDSDRTEVAFSGGTDGFTRGEFQIERGSENGGGVLLSANYEKFDGWRENSERETTSIFLKGAMPVGDRTMLSGYLTYLDRQSQVPGVIPALGDGTIVDVVGGVETYLGYLPTGNNREGILATGRLDHSSSDELQFQVTAQVRSFDSDVRLNFYDFFEFDPTSTIMGVNGFAANEDVDIFFTEATVAWDAGRHNIVAGISSEQAKMDDEDLWSGEIDPFFSGVCGFRFYAILIDYSTGEVVNDTPGNTCFVRDELRTRASTTNTFYGAFVQDEIEINDHWALTLGLRYDKFDREVDFSVVGTLPVDQRATGDADAVSPKASLAYNYDGGMLYGSYGRGFNSNFGPVFSGSQTAMRVTRNPQQSIASSWAGKVEQATDD